MCYSQLDIRYNRVHGVGKRGHILPGQEGDPRQARCGPAESQPRNHTFHPSPRRRVLIHRTLLLRSRTPESIPLSR